MAVLGFWGFHPHIEAKTGMAVLGSHIDRGGTFSTLSCVTGLFFVYFHAEKESENRLFLMLILTLLSACFCFNVLSWKRWFYVDYFCFTRSLSCPNSSSGVWIGFIFWEWIKWCQSNVFSHPDLPLWRTWSITIDRLFFNSHTCVIP